MTIKRSWIKPGLVGVAMLAVLAGPFLLRPPETTNPADADATVVIVTPHAESIRHEFARAFAKHMKETKGISVHIDWRTPGSGTSEIEKYLTSSFRASFQTHWKGTLKRKWSDHEIGDAFDNRKLLLPPDPSGDTPSQSAKRTFLESDLGIGVDLFFGGGAYPFQKFASMGYLVDSGVRERHPDWFSDEVIPEVVGGEPFHDAEMRWVGAALSSFGICYNADKLFQLGITSPPKTWEDLGDPQFSGHIALADPTKSGSVTKAFEMLIQEEMHKAVKAIKPRARVPEEELLAEALNEGWKNGLNLIQRICANARYFTDSATKIPLDIAQGNAAAGMSIDFYGRTYNEILRDKDGYSRVRFITPVGGTSVGADPIAMLRGAPNPEMAQAFIDFVLSKDGQRIWIQKPGTPGGPEETALRRSAIRRDLYVSSTDTTHYADPQDNPFEQAESFQYIPERTAHLFGAIRFIIRAMCIDSHEEMREAWKTLIETDFPKDAAEKFFTVSMVGYPSTNLSFTQIVGGGNPIEEVRESRNLSSVFRSNYKKAKNDALRGDEN
ncbi:MAG: extracellular solute-binding protein [Verrucomicrobiota bacterium]